MRVAEVGSLYKCWRILFGGITCSHSAWLCFPFKRKGTLDWTKCSISCESHSSFSFDRLHELGKTGSPDSLYFISCICRVIVRE